MPKLGIGAIFRSHPGKPAHPHLWPGGVFAPGHRIAHRGKLMNDLGKLLLSALATAEAAFGSSVIPLRALLVMMVLDFISGWMVALRTGKASSETSRAGILQKMGYFLAIGLAYLVDVVLNQDTLLAFPIVTLFLFFTESISVVEHLGFLGVPLPRWLGSRLIKLRDQYDMGGTESSPVTEVKACESENSCPK